METTATTMAVNNQPVTLTKTCSKCGKSLPVSEFSKSSRAKDGLQAWCRHCTSIANKESAARRKAQRNTPPISASHETSIFEQMHDREVIAEIRERIEHLRTHGWMFEGQLKYIQERIVKL